MLTRTMKQAANVSTKNPPTIDEDEGGVTLNTPDKREEGETLEEQRACLQKPSRGVQTKQDLKT